MRIDHIAIWVKDIATLRSFYETYFEAIGGDVYHNTAKQFTSCFLTLEDNCRIELMHIPDQEPHQLNRLGLAHLSLATGSCEKVNQLTERLRTDGYSVISNPRITGDGYYESVVADPEDNIIEITV